MKQYESYKDSGIEWLREIPSHWMEEKLKHLVSCNDDVLDETADPEEIINYVEISDVDSINGVKNHTQYRFKEAPSRARRITKKGDIIVSTVRTYLKAIAPIKEDNLIVSTGFAVLRPRNIESSFVSYALQNELFLGEVVSRSTGVGYPAINSTDLVEIKIPVPSVDEQRIIASYLDDKVSQIDAVIAEKEKMVEDLQNYRKSVISEAVTRGLNLDVPMKDSGIDWIGMIPEHWSITNIGRLFYINAGGDAKPALYSPIKDDEHPFPVYTNSKEADHVYAFSSYAPFPGNSITVTGRGDIGHAIFRENEFDAIIRLLVLQPKQKNIIDSRYFAYFIDEIIHFSTDSAAVGQLSAIQISPYKVCCPQIKEQKAISNYLEFRTSQIDVTIKCINSQIEDLKSYKSSLITEAVTGKIDLR